VHPHHPRRILALSAFVALFVIVLLAAISCAGEPSTQVAPPWHHRTRYQAVVPTTEAPVVVTEAPVSSPSPTSAGPKPTVPRAERPQSFTADGSDAAAWRCLAVLESGNGTASRNLYGISDSRASSMSASEQLAYARRIRDRTGGYAEGWPNTSKECGLG